MYFNKNSFSNKNGYDLVSVMLSINLNHLKFTAGFIENTVKSYLKKLNSQMLTNA